MQTIIEPRRGWRALDLSEIYEYRDLLVFLVLRQLRVQYAQSVVGLGWAILQPFFAMLVFTVIFGTFMRVPSEGLPYAVFSYAALVPWTYFSNSLTDSANSLVINADMISKVYFPRLVLPLSAVIAKLIDFTIAMLLLFVLMAFYGITPNMGVVVIPLLVVLMVGAAVGVGMWLTALNIQYRDIKYGLNFAVQLLMYAAPVVYPITVVPERLRTFYSLNPMVGVIEGFRSALLGTRPMPWTAIGLGGVVTAFLLVSGAYYFRRKERLFADVA